MSLLDLKGMHLLMSFIRFIGNLMANSGLEDILTAAFGGVVKMLTGKKFPQNFRALRMVLACNCQAEEPCKRGNCSCKSLQTACTIFCKCIDGKCANPWTVSELEEFEGELI